MIQPLKKREKKNEELKMEKKGKENDALGKLVRVHYIF